MGLMSCLGADYGQPVVSCFSVITMLSTDSGKLLLKQRLTNWCEYAYKHILDSLINGAEVFDIILNTTHKLLYLLNVATVFSSLALWAQTVFRSLSHIAWTEHHEYALCSYAMQVYFVQVY